MKEIQINDLSLQSYKRFLEAKLDPRHTVKGNTIILSNHTTDKTQQETTLTLSSFLFDYQKWITEMAFKRERFAVFADCGLGKTLIFLEYARLASKSLPPDMKVLIISPLMVIQQTRAQEKQFYEGNLFDDIHASGLQAWLDSTSKYGIINYDKFRERIELQGKVGCVILDESSILKNEVGVIRTNIINATKGVRFKLACTGTPAPNDREEYANHALFLEQIRSHQEFFARFFINRDNGWELKPHAKEAFYRYLASFSVYLRDPKRYNFKDIIGSLEAPEFDFIDVALTDEQQEFIGEQVWKPSQAMMRRQKLSQISKGFMLDKGKKTVRVRSRKPAIITELIKRNLPNLSLVWVLYNEEGELIKEELERNNIAAIHIRGEMTDDDRITAIQKFLSREVKVLVTKPRLLGFGLNLQECQCQIWSGLSDSYEAFYQATKRSHRFGAKGQLKSHVLVTNHERKFLRNVLRKSKTFEEDAGFQERLYIQHIIPEMHEGKTDEATIKPREVRSKAYWLINGDSVEELRRLPQESVDLAVFSPPFAALFTYTSELADLGNCSDNDDEFKLHFRFFLQGLWTVMKKGHIVCMHLSQLATFKGKEGYIGLKDFRGDMIKLFQEFGFIYFGEWAIPKNPQMQAIKEKVRTLSFAQLESDRLGSRPGLSDFILIFKKPGEADTKLDDCEVSRDEWIEWACGVWTGIRESHTLNVAGTKSEDDIKHVCPLNLTVIERCIRMYSKQNDLVLSPFMGIGSEGVVAVGLGRRFLGIELKQEYYEQAKQNIVRADNGILPVGVRARPARMSLETFWKQS